jgi:hypothetical protein
MIDEPRGSRFDAAIELLREGREVGYKEIRVRLTGDGATEIALESSWSIQNVTEERAKRDLTVAEALMDELEAAAPAVRDAVRGRRRRLQLIDDYGTGSLLICEIDNSVFRWAPGFGSRGAT